MIVDIELDYMCDVCNSDRLPEYTEPVYGDLFVFHWEDGKHVNTITARPHINTYCEGCVFDATHECPWEPVSGEPLCDIYECKFNGLDKFMEEI